MASPRKSGLEYFPLDTEMDGKVEDLETLHGLAGFGVFFEAQGQA